MTFLNLRTFTHLSIKGEKGLSLKGHTCNTRLLHLGPYAVSGSRPVHVHAGAVSCSVQAYCIFVL